MADLAILKHVQGLSDKVLCERWVENPYFQLSCGEEFFQHKPPFDRSWLTRWRQRMGEKKLARVQESLSVATRTGVAKLSDFSKIIVDTTVQEMAPQLDALRDAGCGMRSNFRGSSLRRQDVSSRLDASSRLGS
jgi:IS5 family transposase